MHDRLNSRLLFSLLMEFMLLAAPIAAFLFYYSRTGTGVTTETYVSHVAVGAVFWGYVLLARWLLWRLFPRGAAFCSALLCALASLILWSYYLIAVVGLAGFGKIITWPLLRPYLTNPGATLEYAGIALPWGLMGGFALIVLLLLVWWLVTGSGNWLVPLSRQCGKGLFAIVSIGFLSILGVCTFDFLDNPPAFYREPVSLTFFPKPPDVRDNKTFRHDAVLEAAENSVRQDFARAGRHVPDAKRNIVLIVSDALRFDHTSLFGYARDTTPLLAKRFNQNAAAAPMYAVAVCAETMCAMPGLLYSKPPEQMHDKAIGLSEALQAHGYKSYILLAGDHTHYYNLASFYRPADIFFDSSTQNQRFINDDLMLMDVVDSLPNFDGKAPVFIQFHLQSNHPLGIRWPDSNWYQPFENYARWLNKESELPDNQRKKAINYYDNGVRQADIVIDRLLNMLEHKGYLKNTLVLVTADHGEMLGEHHLLSHTIGVFAPVLDVPAIFLRYGYQTHKIPERKWVSQIDLAPTILTELEVPPIATWQGVPLQKKDERDFFTFQQKNVSGLLYLLQPYEGYKYWIDIKNKKEYVFNLNNDPDEMENIIFNIPENVLQRWRHICVKNLMQTSNSTEGKP